MDGRPRSRRSFLASAFTRAAALWVSVTGGLAALAAGCDDRGRILPEPKYGPPPPRETLYGAPRPQVTPMDDAPKYGAPAPPRTTDNDPRPVPVEPPPPTPVQKKYGAPPGPAKYGAPPPPPKYGAPPRKPKPTPPEGT